MLLDHVRKDAPACCAKCHPSTRWCPRCHCRPDVRPASQRPGQKTAFGLQSATGISMSFLGTTAQYQAALRELARHPGRAGQDESPPAIRYSDEQLPARALSHHRPLDPAGTVGDSVLTFLLYRSILLEGRSPDSIVALFLAGVLGWTFAEYWLHRWVFHFAPSGNRAIRAIQFALHGYHHEFPDDPNRLVAPPMLAVPIRDISGGRGHGVFQLTGHRSGRGILRLSVLRLDALLLSSRSPAFQDRKIHAPLSP